MSEPSNFEGHEGRECGEHRTVGPHRAWCHDCGEWCYPEGPCANCELPVLRKLLDERNAEVARLRAAVDGFALRKQIVTVLDCHLNADFDRLSTIADALERQIRWLLTAPTPTEDEEQR